jgi:hypothetical protein
MAPETIGFAGEHLVITDQPDGTLTVSFETEGSGRKCGACTLCCKLVPVPTIGKVAGQRCPKSKAGHGCTIYADRPMPCRLWSCRWLSDAKTAGMPRPDRAHYVIDMEADVISIREDGSGVVHQLDVIQVWVDPAFPDAHRAPELRAYLLMFAERYRAAAIIRWSSTKAMVLFAPPLTSNGQWHEESGPVVARNSEEAMVLAQARERSVSVAMIPD